MKKLIFIVICILVITTFVFAGDMPRRLSTSVSDVYKPYTADAWIISPDDKPTVVQTADNTSECEIKGVISCFDNEFLRVDILLNEGVSLKWDLWYAVKIDYGDIKEYYTYYPTTKQLLYEEENKKKITDSKVLNKDNSRDDAGLTDSGGKKNASVYFILNKIDHINGKKGKNYYIICNFYSGFWNTNNQNRIAQQTIPVELEFTY